MTDSERTCEIWADGPTLCKTHNRPPSECIAALEAENEKLSAAGVYLAEQHSAQFRKLASLAAALHVDTIDEIGQRFAALEADRDARGNLLALAAAEINCSGPVHERIRVLRRELTERAESAESRLAIAVEYIEDLEFNEADYEDNRWRRDATAAMEKERREALAKIQGKE